MRHSIALFCALLFSSLIAATGFSKPALHFSAVKGQAVDIAEYSYSLPSTEKLTVNFTFDKSDAKRLWSLMSENQGSQVRIKIGEMTTLMPTVREVPTGSSLQMSVQDSKTFEGLKKALESVK